ncbi:MAG TPA: hypothetical protein VFI19_04305 [Nocardioides sp.]|nr:hypothetical protein [Nocardioides sp.]
MELRELDEFRTVRRVAAEDVRALTVVAPESPDVVAARGALEAATTAEDVIALEHLVVAAWCALRLTVAEDRAVRVGGRWVPWEELGCYRGVVEAVTRAAR